MTEEREEEITCSMMKEDEIPVCRISRRLWISISWGDSIRGKRFPKVITLIKGATTYLDTSAKIWVVKG